MVSLFKDTFSKDVKYFNPLQIVKWIIDGQWKEKVEALRKLDKENYNKEKTKLPGICWSGTFPERLASKIEAYSGLICLDIDHIQPDQITRLKGELVDDEHVLVAFTSPSGEGLKVVYSVDSGAEHHKNAFLHLQHYFQEKYKVEIDKSGKDICRLCFVSFDQMAIARSATPFQVDLKFGEVTPQPKKLSNTAPVFDTEKIFDVCVRWAERTYQYVEGQRNAFIHALACAMNRCGVSLDDCTATLNNNYDLPEDEIKKACKSAYFHHQAEHGTVTVTSIGAIDDYKAPAYEISYDDDLIMNDIKRLTGLLYEYKVPQKEMLDIVAKVAKFYNSTKMIDIQKKPLLNVVNEAIATYKQNLEIASSRKTLDYMLAESLADMIIGHSMDDRVIPTGFADIDTALRGGLMPGNFYGDIGTDQTYKSIFAQYLAAKTACNDKPVLYLNGEMSIFQFYERLSLLTLNVNLYDYIKNDTLTKENVAGFIERMQRETDGNLFFVHGSGWDQENILATIDNIKLKTGKVIEMVIVDGVTQMSWGKEKNEIGATIQNSGVCKEIAKNAHEGKGVVVLGLFHVSGENDKLYRHPGLRVRGGVKTLANMDGYFGHSLFEEPPQVEGTNDVSYKPGMFYLRCVDKRGVGGTINNIIKVQYNLHLEVEKGDPSVYETSRSTSYGN